MEELSLREMQKECARALLVLGATNTGLAQINKKANHDSQNWYREVIRIYTEQYGDLPSKVGPGKDIKLISED